jgi:hypothetical protein
MMRMLLLSLPLMVLAGCAGGEAESAETAGSAAAETVALAQAPSATQFYEMRTYTTHPGKLEDLNRRFRDHTRRIFEKHGMTNVGYWIPQDSARSQNTLVYILAYPSAEAREQAWAGFREDPEWAEARTASEVNGPIVQRVESVFMHPTDYSALQ